MIPTIKRNTGTGISVRTTFRPKSPLKIPAPTSLPMSDSQYGQADAVVADKATTDVIKASVRPINNSLVLAPVRCLALF